MYLRVRGGGFVLDCKLVGWLGKLFYVFFFFKRFGLFGVYFFVVEFRNFLKGKFWFEISIFLFLLYFKFKVNGVGKDIFFGGLWGRSVIY